MEMSHIKTGEKKLYFIVGDNLVCHLTTLQNHLFASRVVSCHWFSVTVKATVRSKLGLSLNL